MNKFIEMTGKTEEEAIQAALVELGCDRDDVSVEVLERAKTGFLGIGSTNARVRIVYSREETVEEKVEAFLTGLFEKMGVSASADITEDNGVVSVVISGDDPGALIGRRGETLDAIQHLANYAINRGTSSRVRINIDAENYRQRRDEALVRLAEKIAGKVVKYRRNMTLEPMNSYERHVIHTALQNYENITTYSVGNEPNRRIVVAYERNGAADAPKEDAPKYREWC